MPPFDYDLNGWDAALCSAFYAIGYISLVIRFHICTPIDEEH